MQEEAIIGQDLPHVPSWPHHTSERAGGSTSILQIRKQPCRVSCDLLKITSRENSEKLESRAFLFQFLLGPPHSNFRPRSTTINSMGGTLKCPQGPTSNQDDCCALGWPADYDSDNANTRASLCLGERHENLDSTPEWPWGEQPTGARASCCHK